MRKRMNHRRHALWLAVGLSLLLCSPAWATAQQADGSGTEVQQEARSALAALGRMQDVDTALAMAADGALLYQADAVKLDGYEYCSQAVELAEQGRFRESTQAASKALHIALQTGNTDLLGKAYRDLAIAFNYGRQLERAEQFANLALKYPGQNPQQVQGPAGKIIGDVRMRQGRFQDAIEIYQAALAQSSDRYRPLVQASLVNAFVEAGELPHARALADQLAVPTEPAQQAELLRTHGRLLLAEQKPAEALQVYQQLVDSSVAGDELFYRAWGLDGVSQSHVALGDRVAAAAALDESLGMFDKARAHFRSDDFKMGLFSDLQSVFERAITMHTDLGQAEQAFDISERSRARALLDAVAERGKVDAAAISAVDARSLRARLRNDEVVVAYHSLQDRLLVWVLTQQGVREVKLPIALGRDDLARLVDAYRDGLIKLNPAMSGTADKVGQLLLEPLGLEADKRLIIIPHGPLHYLPFQSLRLGGQYMIERNPISIAPSISIAARLAERTPTAAARMTAFGNPTISEDVAPPLPGAEAEVRDIVRYYPGAKVFFNADANKSNFVASTPQARIVHVAAHATADLLDPMQSKVLLADENGRANYLLAEDVVGMDLNNAALIALSACESGLGRVAAGDEVLGFPRSFLSAGASSLLVSLWPVSDAATEKLMTALYSDLANGASIQDAMRTGQLAVLHDPGNSHPYFWSSFNLIGNWRLRVTK